MRPPSDMELNCYPCTNGPLISQSLNESHRDRYLTIKPVALSGYGSIAHEAKPNGGFPLVH